MAKRKTRKNKSLPRYLPELLIACGILLVVISLVHNILKFNALSIDRQTVAQYAASATPEDLSSVPAHIFIPWNTDGDIAPGVYEDSSWTVSPDHVTYLMGSARPGAGGNVIIYGHNKRSILGNIRALKGGEIITLTTKDGSAHRYLVSGVSQVKPLDTSLLEPTDHEVLTLFTCSGPLDSLRYVVRAEPTAVLIDPVAVQPF